MRIYNTLARTIEEFKPIKPPKVGIYICGPTVWDYAHLGHSRTYVNSDVLVRSLKWLDFEPYVVMNITDVGHLTSQADTGQDKMEKKALEEQNRFWKLLNFTQKIFLRCRNS